MVNMQDDRLVHTLAISNIARPRAMTPPRYGKDWPASAKPRSINEPHPKTSSVLRAQLAREDETKRDDLVRDEDKGCKGKVCVSMLPWRWIAEVPAKVAREEVGTEAANISTQNAGGGGGRAVIVCSRTFRSSLYTIQHSKHTTPSTYQL